MAQPEHAMRFILWLLVAAAISNGQERFQFFNTDNGLPHNSILALLQARDGYLWFTTYRGLVRFDGVRFQVFDRSNTPAIHGTTYAAFSLMEDSQGAIWAGAWSAGALRYHNGTFTSFTKRDGLPNNSVLRIDEDDEGTIWFYTSPGLSRLRNGKIEVVHTIDGEPVEQYLEKPSNLGADTHLFGLWRISRGNTGLQRFARGKWSNVPLPPDLKDPSTARIEVTLEDSRGRIWYTILDRPTESYCVENGKLTIYKGLPPGAFANYRDRLGRLWITDRSGRTALWQNGQVTPFSGLSTSSPLRILEDDEGSLWAGTLNQGLAHASLQIIHSLRLPGGTEPNTIQPITQDNNGNIWVGSYGLTRIRDGRSESFLIPRPMAKWSGDQSVWALWPEPDGTLLLSNNHGLMVFKDGIIRWPDPPLDSIKTRVNAIIRDRHGSLWLGGGQGVYRFQNSKLTLLPTESGPKLRGEVRALAEDRLGTVWVGTDALLCKTRKDGLACFGSGDELTQWRVRGIHIDQDNVTWASTADRGLIRVEGDDLRWIEAKDGLFSNDGAGILEDAEGYLWIGSRLGIYRVSRKELNDFVRGKLSRVTSSHFGKNDGLNATDTAGFGQPKGFVARNGTLWFPTTDGLATIEPSTLEFNNSPVRVQIDNCTLNQHRIPCDGQINLPPGGGNLEIGYTALNLVRSDQIQFRYRLEGLDTDWVDAGNRRTAYFSHLPPGTYRFQVLAANSFGAWNDVAKELSLTVQPHYYQTIWFRAFGSAAVIGLLMLVWRLREAHYTRRQERQRAFSQQIIASQEAERKRIASELHDSLGQRLTVIKNMALLLSRPESRNREEQAEAIAAETSQAVAEVRQISRNLRPYQLDLLGLTKSIEVLVTRTCEAAGIRCDLVIDNLSGALRKESEIHFYRIVQECVNNTVKHAGASTISVFAQRSAAGVSLVVSDDGVGFDLGHARREGLSGGFGLTGISERAQLLGGKASIRSMPGQGTTVTIEIDFEAKPEDRAPSWSGELTHGR